MLAFQNTKIRFQILKDGSLCKIKGGNHNFNTGSNTANIDLSEYPPKWSGSTQRRVRGSECQSGQEESSPNLSWSDGMGSCLSSGKVGRFIFVFYVLSFSNLVIKLRDLDLTTHCSVVLELCVFIQSPLVACSVLDSILWETGGD